MATRRNFTLTQTLIAGRFNNTRMPTEFIDESVLNSSSFDVFDHALPLGISPGYSDKGRLVALAIADDQNCRIVMFQSGRRTTSRSAGLAILQEKILCRSPGDLYAFDMAPLTMLLCCDLGLRITNAVDIQSGFSAVDRQPLTAIKKLVGESTTILVDNVEMIFRNPIFNPDSRRHPAELASRAWISQLMATFENGEEVFAKVKRINTKDMSDEQLRIVAKLSTDALRLDNKKPTEVTHSVILSTDPVTQAAQLESQSFNTRVRRNMNVRLDVNNNNGSINYRVHGNVGGARGRKNIVQTSRSLQGATVMTITSIGRDDPTTAEAQRAATVLRILQGQLELLNGNPWIKNVWFPSDDGLMAWPEEWSKPTSLRSPSGANPPLSNISLNASQQKAVNTMLSSSGDNRITLIQGPPGTGKTSVIAAFVQWSISLGRTGIWLVAQSNVAVKNIAEKLIKVQFFDWRLLVSVDFHFDWHEHLYSRVNKNVIRSDRFKFSQSELEGVSVILCTLSMLSNSKLKPTFMKKVPLNIMVVDEASQIEIGSYMSTFTQFESTLRKVCFIGDDKQLPPYGQEDIEDLQSIFELPHLNKPEKAIFLDTQYRMPPQIGQFISKVIYDDKLNSNPLHPVQDDVIACRFIDAGGKESKCGDSYQNNLECDVAIRLAAKLQELGQSYRIITPYTAQRQLIEDQMKEVPGMHWGDKCFSVDSFQGNEDDYIIISVVRSLQIGFLKNVRRTNVMLTRCKRGMYIISSQKFLEGPGANSLVGEMAKAAGFKGWLDIAEIDTGDFLT
ncbi:hypothetical protein AX15_002018 [Amanita polypyramis BW_CC]|nr:hypothetical protein AX15_002018 [Amanita polypyramis BW_CC]